MFAAPWANNPMLPPMEARPQHAYATNFAPALGPQYAHADSYISAGGPDHDDFMSSIREQAIFAWALTGINGSLHKFGHGRPMGDAVPQDGLPIWESDPAIDLTRSDSGPTNIDGHMKGSGLHRERDIFGDPGLARGHGSGASSSGRSADGEFRGR